MLYAFLGQIFCALNVVYFAYLGIAEFMTNGFSPLLLTTPVNVGCALRSSR